jgi:hypothetical protein
MRRLAMGLLAPCALLMTACGADEPEDVDVPPAAEQVQLEALQGSGITGEIAVTPRDNDTHIVVNVMNAPADETLNVRLHSGTCQSPGVEISNIGTIRTTDDGRGAIDATIGEAPGLIMDGNHIAVIWMDYDRDRDWTGDPATARQPGDTMPGQQPADPRPMDQQQRTDQQRMDDQRTGLLRDNQRAVACSTLPRRF